VSVACIQRASACRWHAPAPEPASDGHGAKRIHAAVPCAATPVRSPRADAARQTYRRVHAPNASATASATSAKLPDTSSSCRRAAKHAGGARIERPPVESAGAACTFSYSHIWHIS
jgi:hypothetical protein